MRNPSDNKIEVTSYSAVVHPAWDSSSLANDLALVQLPAALELTDFVSPVCLPVGGQQVQAGDTVTVLGWGKDSDSGRSTVTRHNSPVVATGRSHDVRTLEVPLVGSYLKN